MIKSSQKTLRILELFTYYEGKTISLSELTNLSGMPKPTVNRIITTLVHEGFLSQEHKKGSYSVGPKLVQLSYMIRNKIQIKDIAMPHLADLYNKVDEMVSLYTWDGREMFLVETIMTNHNLAVMPTPGNRPLYCMTPGKLFLATMTEQQLDAYLNETKLTPYTASTITDVSILKKQLRAIAREGIAYNDEEYMLGIRGIAGAINNSEGIVSYCVTVAGPSVRLNPIKMMEYSQEVKHCAIAISSELGYKDRSVI